MEQRLCHGCSRFTRRCFGQLRAWLAAPASGVPPARTSSSVPASASRVEPTGAPTATDESAWVEKSLAEILVDKGEAGGMRGAVMLGDEMIDEASRKMALVVAGKGRAAGMSRTSTFTPPES